MPNSHNHASLIERAVILAKRGTGLVEPNPRVGALVVRQGEIVAEGWHRAYGGPHAEVMALNAAGVKSRGADLYLTLEPCSTHGKTEPCTDAIIATGIRRVFYAMSDPNPVNGRRAKEVLLEAGIEVVELGVTPATEDLLKDFTAYMRGTLPWVLLKWAMTADGKVATAGGDARWISSEESRAEVHVERQRSDAVLVGRATVKSDDPLLTARMNGGSRRQPVRVVLDSGLHLDPAAKIVQTASEVPTWVFHCAGPEADDRRHTLEAFGVRTLAVGKGEDGRLNPCEALQLLRREGLHRIFVEGGPTVHGALLSQGLADWARVYISPLLVGGMTAPGPVAGPGFATLDLAVWLKDVHVRVVGDHGSDLVMEGRIGNHREA
ncbi:MAG: bifunctional diaminohydroxyphosphoribosylaminopyrimidine deaminase/5-amino-6-(5-phosphoribosylamino)uracil reductase RibD [Planctomycetes bacterium]|nr:bifunctional diaminohydroxyphosphoribosylaminopyrimidine deaminase/5-amino-6-(5-phosphoribosylamino)uracil reductase RibD [Planctomycetota bacterium]